MAGPCRSASLASGDSAEVYNPAAEEESPPFNKKVEEDGRRASQVEGESFRSHRGGHLLSKSSHEGDHGVQPEEGEL